jgi:tetratricopeptide (TPR) repeat protein
MDLTKREKNINSFYDFNMEVAMTQRTILLTLVLALLSTGAISAAKKDNKIQPVSATNTDTPIADDIILPSASDEKLMGAKELFDLGLHFYKRDSLDRAEDYYRKALDKNPEYTIVYEYLGDVMFDKKEIKDARKNYMEALKRDANNSDLCSKIALTFEFNDAGERYGEGYDYESCVGYYKKAISLNQKDSDNYLNLAKVNFQAGKDGEALIFLKSLVKIKIDDGEAYYLLGRIYENRNNPKVATEYYRLSDRNSASNSAWKQDLKMRLGILLAKKK